MLEGWFIWKVGSIALSGVQKHFCIISGSRDISKTIWGIRFQEFEIMNNLEIWYQRDSCLISLAMNISEGWDISHFKGDILRRVLSSNPFPYNIREPKYKQNNMEHKISKHYIVKYLTIFISDIPFCFAHISVTWCRTEMFLYSRQSYGSHL